jgi:hypothetical protein
MRTRQIVKTAIMVSAARGAEAVDILGNWYVVEGLECVAGRLTLDGTWLGERELIMYRTVATEC